jgi:glutathione peroxidase
MASAYDFSFETVAGKPYPLKDLAGRPLLVVNTASKCGFTPQYKALEAVWKQYQGAGLVVIAVPSNDFGGQEPGTPQEITTFCTTKYHITFPMFEKVDVKGPTKAPVYEFLTNGFPEPTWNFCKYLVDKTGKVLKEYPSAVTPEDAGLRADIDAALAKPVQ